MATFTVAANAHTTVTTGWTNPSNAFATTADSSFATAAPAKNSTVNGDFGFPNIASGDVPDNATISSVTITVNWGMTAAVTGGTLGVQLRNNGANLGTETTQTTTGQTDATQVVLSGVTVADLRSASTLLKARVRCTKGNTNSAMTGNLDFVSMTVNYVIPAPKVNVFQANRRAGQSRLAARRLGAVAVLGLSSPWVSGSVNAPIPLGRTITATAASPSATVNKPIPFGIVATAAGSGGTPSTAVPGVQTVVHRKAPARRGGGYSVLGIVTPPATLAATVNKPIPFGRTITATTIDSVLPGISGMVVQRIAKPHARPHRIFRRAPQTVVVGSSATVNKPIPFGRSATAKVRVDGTVAKQIVFGRSATATVRVDATLSKAIPIGRFVRAAVPSSATLSKAIPIGLSAVAKVRVDATLAKPISLGRTITATALSTGLATLSKAIPLAITSTAKVRVDVTLSRQIVFSRTATAQVRVDATLSKVIPFGRTIAATSLGSGELFFAKPIPISGSATATVRVDATLAQPILFGCTIVANNGLIVSYRVADPTSVTLSASRTSVTLPESRTTVTLPASTTSVTITLT